jgi:hypothetical protein
MLGTECKYAYATNAEAFLRNEPNLLSSSDHSHPRGIAKRGSCRRRRVHRRERRRSRSAPSKAGKRKICQIIESGSASIGVYGNAVYPPLIHASTLMAEAGWLDVVCIPLTGRARCHGEARRAVNAGSYLRNVRVRRIDENSGRACGLANQGGRSVTLVELTL